MARNDSTRRCRLVQQRMAKLPHWRVDYSSIQISNLEKLKRNKVWAADESTSRKNKTFVPSYSNSGPHYLPNLEDEPLQMHSRVTSSSCSRSLQFFFCTFPSFPLLLFCSVAIVIRHLVSAGRECSCIGNCTSVDMLSQLEAICFFFVFSKWVSGRKQRRRVFWRSSLFFSGSFWHLFFICIDSFHTSRKAAYDCRIPFFSPFHRFKANFHPFQYKNPLSIYSAWIEDSILDLFVISRSAWRTIKLLIYRIHWQQIICLECVSSFYNRLLLFKH